MPPAQLSTLLTRRRKVVLAGAETQNGAEGPHVPVSVPRVPVSVPRLPEPLFAHQTHAQPLPPASSIPRMHLEIRATASVGKHFQALTGWDDGSSTHTRLTRVSGPHGAEVMSVPAPWMTEASKASQHNRGPPSPGPSDARLSPWDPRPPHGHSRVLQSPPPLDFPSFPHRRPACSSRGLRLRCPQRPPRRPPLLPRLCVSGAGGQSHHGAGSGTFHGRSTMATLPLSSHRQRAQQVLMRSGGPGPAGVGQGT